MSDRLDDFINKVKCFTNKKKILIINYLLEKGEATIDSITEDLDMNYSQAYSYLQDFVDTGLILSEKSEEGKTVYSPSIVDIRISEGSISTLLGNIEIKGIIFDVDDTLVYREDIPGELAKAGKEAVQEAKRSLMEKGMSISEPPEELFSKEWIFSKYGNSVEWYIRTWLEVAGVLDNDLKRKLTKKYKNYYYDRIEKTARYCDAFKDVKPILEYLSRKGLILGAHSNSSRDTMIELFKKNDIIDYFYHEGEFCIVSGDEISKSPEAIEKVMSLMGLDEDECYMVGDSANDLRVAREADIPPKKTIAVYRGMYPLKNLKGMSPPPLIINHLKELIPEILGESEPAIDLPKQPITNVTEVDVEEKVLIVNGEDPAFIERILNDLVYEYVKLFAHRDYNIYRCKSGDEVFNLAVCGIGSPTTAILIEEMAKCGAETFIRAGTSGGLNKDLELNDVVVTDSSYCEEGTSKSYVGEDYNATASEEIVNVIEEKASELGINHKVGKTVSVDGFYSIGARESGGEIVSDCYEGYKPKDLKKVKDFKEMDLLNLDMETNCVLTLTDIHNLKGGSICGISNPIPWTEDESSFDFQNSLKNAIQVGIEAMEEL